MLREEVLHERRDVLLALAKRWHVDVDDVQPVEEVIAEFLLLDLLCEILVGRAHDPDVDLDGERRADPLDLSFLQHTEKLRLHRQAHLADLIKEDGALVGELEATPPLRHRAGERALLMAEELGLEERLRQGGARHLHHRARAAVGVVVERLRDQLLAGAALAGHENGRIRLRDLADRLVDLLHRRGVAHDALGLDERADLVAKDLHLAGEIAVLDHAFHGVTDLVELERLRDVVERAKLHCPDRVIARAERGHDEHAGLGGAHLQL